MQTYNPFAYLIINSYDKLVKVRFERSNVLYVKHS